MLRVVAIICSIVVLSHELVIKTDDIMKSFYKIEKVDTPDEFPIFIQHTNIGNSKDLLNKIISPDNQYDVFKVENSRNYLIIKSKEAIDVVPNGLVQRLDKIKYMILWLNLYCEMHRDCDKSVLDEELRKVVSAMGEAKETNQIF